MHRFAVRDFLVVLIGGGVSRLVERVEERVTERERSFKSGKLHVRA